jgi:hypothetical protein
MSLHIGGKYDPDFVKGSSKFGYPVSIQKELCFIGRSMPLLIHILQQPELRIFSVRITGCIAAQSWISYDHFLASDNDLFNEESLLHFTKEVYQNAGE